MAAIMDLKFKISSNHQNNINYEFFGQKIPKNHILCSIVGKTIENVISNMVDGGHFGFWPLTEYARIFASGTPAHFFIQPS